MILIDAGERSEAAFAAKLLFAGQLGARGYEIGIDERTLPGDLDRAQKYEAARFLVDADDVEVSDLLIIGAETLSLPVLDGLRAGRFGPGVRVAGIGRFADPQAAIGARSKLAYALGREPEIVDLRLLLPRALAGSGPLPMAARLVPESQALRGPARLLVFLPSDQLRDGQTLAALDLLACHPGLRLTVATTERAGERPGRWPGGTVTLLPHADLPPGALAANADIAAVSGHGLADDRVAAAVLEMMGSRKPVIDCTEGAVLITCGAPALQGPERIAALPGYLDQAVLPNLADITRLMQGSGWLQDHSLERLEAALGLEPPPAAIPQPSRARTVFVPTNGVGLGHAQRCALIARAMPDPGACAFAAFPSCVPLVEDAGFACLPLVQKSADHADGYANDLMNYLRLSRMLEAGDRLVFDGGYIFESIFRLILEKNLTSVWVRRGLWQAGQTHPRIVERARIFDRIIVPEEAFEELNDSPGLDRQVRHVGPVVRLATDGADPRGMLQARLGRSFGELVVTMLGGGTAADRTAQLQMLCNLFERREDCLHLIVVWPGGPVSPTLFGWKNSQVVQTRNALGLALAADLVISAAGYNSFHEILYHRLPAILVPQMAPFMDDQDRRAKAAAERELAAAVAASELLRLEAEVRAFLDEGKAADIRARLAATDLPPTGNVAAAALIAEVGRR